MADNVQITPGLGVTVAADEVGGALYQRVKPVHGVDGQATDVSATNPMPVQVIGDLTNAIETLREAINTLNRRTNLTVPDTTGRTRVIFDTASSLNVINTMNALVSLGNPTIPTFELIRSMSRTGYNSGVRANLVIS